MEHLIKYRKYLLIFSIFDIKTTEWCQCTALSAPQTVLHPPAVAYCQVWSYLILRHCFLCSSSANFTPNQLLRVTVLCAQATIFISDGHSTTHQSWRTFK